MSATHENRSGPGVSTDRCFILGTLLLFTVVGAANAVSHEMWRDELNAWAIAREATSFGHLRENMAYEVHPRLWYVTLYALTRLTHSPIAMQWLHLAFAVCAMFIWVRYAPFSRFQRALFVLGYFPLYEYGTICRNYVQGELCAFWLCASFPLARQRPLLAAAPLFLLAQTSAHGFILAAGFGVALIHGLSAPRAVACRWIVVSLVAGLALSAVSLWPKQDADHLEQPWFFQLDLARGLDVVAVFSRAYVPLPLLEWFHPSGQVPWLAFPRPVLHFWCSNLLDSYLGLQLLLSVCLVAAALATFRPRPASLLLFVIASLGMVAFGYLKSPGQIRHQGHLFLAFVCALWVASVEDDATPRESSIGRPATASRFFSVLLVFHAFAGLGASAVDWVAPFSGSGTMADHLERTGLARQVVVAEPDAITAPVAILLNRSFYYVDADRVGSFVYYRERQHSFDANHLARYLDRNAQLLWLTNRPIRAEAPAAGVTELVGRRIAFRLLHRTAEAIRWDEQYYLYLIQPVRR